MAATPKFKSMAFKDALAQLKSIFDTNSLGIVLLDALERRAAEQIYGKVAKSGGRGRLSGVPKVALVGQLTGWFFSSNDVAYRVMKEMDRSCQKERHIVASIPEEQASERVGSYRAIAFKRERAKFVWALSRDERPGVSKLANRIINEFFTEVADLEKARAIADGDDTTPIAEDVELAKRLQEQAERLSEATEKVTTLESKVSGFEAERAQLLVQMGAKERAARQQAQAREELESQLENLKDKLNALEKGQERAEAAKQAEKEARAVADDLAQKVRRLEKLAGASGALSDLQAELEKERKKYDELKRQHTRQEQGYQRERAELDRERGRLRAELQETQDELRRARKHITELERADRTKLSDETPEAGTVLVLLDQANLAGIATQNYGRKVNFSALLDHVRAGRNLVKAIAFVVDNGGAAFAAFCDTLRKSGWEIRLKKPKRFADGTTKADWDMGLAMEAIDLVSKAETVVLGSGDGDFAPLVRRLQRFGQKVEVAAFREGLAKDLAQVADRVIALDQSTLEG